MYLNKPIEFVDIDISIDKNDLFISEHATITVYIKNNSSAKIENGMLKFFINDSVFRITDNQIKSCVNDFASIGDIVPDKAIHIDIPVEIISTPTKGFAEVFCSLNYTIANDGSIDNFSYNSDKFIINLLTIKSLDQNHFKITTSKSEYLFNENIDFDITLKNDGLHKLKNLIISNFVPENTQLIARSISASKANKATINSDTIVINELMEHEEVHVKFVVSVNPDLDIDFIESKAHLKYLFNDRKLIECDASPSTVILEDAGLFNSNNFIYNIDKEEAYINDIITHTITIKNRTGTVSRNLSVKSIFLKKLEFVENSLVVNGIYRVGEYINKEVKLGELEPSEDLVLTYQTKVLDVFESTKLDVSLSYDTPKKNLTQTSNACNLKVISPVFSRDNFIKKVDKETCSIGDIITFTIEVLNTGTVKGDDILLTDTLSNCFEFVKGSVLINDRKTDRNIIEEGILLNDIIPNKKCIVKYQAKVIDVDKEIKSNATLTYKIEGITDLKTIYTNNIYIRVLGAKIGNNDFIKELSSYTVQTGDIITVKLFIENRGNLTCKNLKIQEPINPAVEFVEGSLVANNKEHINGNIFNGVIFNSLKKDDSLVLTYQFKILDFPKPNPIDDRALLSYSYLNDYEIENKTIYSTKTKLYVNNPELEVIDKTSFLENGELYKYCHCNDYVFYNLVLENRGNVDLESIYLTLKFPEDLPIDFQTLKINNTPYQKKQESSILLPNLDVSKKTYIEFYAKNNFLDNYNIESFVYLNYTFKDLKSNEIIRHFKSLKENILVINPNLEVTKFISDTDIEVTREFTKNITIKNTGNVNLENINLNLNENRFLHESEKTVFINGMYCNYENNNNLKIDYLNVDESVNIAIRYNLSNIPLSQSVIHESEVTATYQFNNNYSPIVIKKKSNKIVLDIKNYLIEVDGKCNSKTVLLNNIYTYVFKITNLGNVNCNALKLNLDLPDYVDYIDNSFNINGKKFSVKKINSSINLDGLNYNETLNVAFNFVINKLPYKKQAKINAVVYARYNDGDLDVNKSFKSKEGILNVENIELDMVKTLSSDALQSGDTLKIQTIINNVGSVDIYDLVLKDNYENSLFFIDGSVYLDGEHMLDLDPTSGIHLNELPSGKNLLLSYEYEYIPKLSLNRLLHYSDLQYVYNFDDSKDEVGTLRSDSMYVEGLLSTFKQFSVEHEYKLKDYEPNIGEIVNLFAEAKVEDFYEINTIKNKSIGNSNATGKKVIIKGSILNRVEYLTSDRNTHLYMLEITYPFTVFVNLPFDYDDEDLYFKAKYDDTFYKTTSERGVFVSSLISIEGLT